MPLAAMAAIGVGSSIFGGIMGNKAANAQVNAQQQALGLQREMYQQNRADAMPWMQNGQNASNRLAYLLGLGDPNQAGPGGFGSLAKNFDASTFQQDPGYQFRLAEGQKALERSAAARGTTFSGGTLKALDQYNQGFASNEYQNAYNRYNQNRSMNYGFLSGVSGQGLQAEGNVSQAGQNYANQGSQIYGNIGNAQAQGYANWANSIGNAGTDAMGAIYANYQNGQYQQLINALKGRNMTGNSQSAYSGGYPYGGG